MKITVWILVFLIALSVILLFVLGVISRTGQAPGLTETRLSRCPGSPNCVCSEYADDANHYVDPIRIQENLEFNVAPVLKKTIVNMGGTIQEKTGDYIASTFSSALFGFVDDFEVRIDSTQNVIHLRSASRAGYGDAGVNKKRVELFKKLYNENVSEADPSRDGMRQDGAP
jgi:uncharacterized protein (DUF1499 family)